MGSCLPCAWSTCGWPSFFLRLQAWVPRALPCNWGQCLGSRCFSAATNSFAGRALEAHPWPWVSLPAQPLEDRVSCGPSARFLWCLTVTSTASVPKTSVQQERSGAGLCASRVTSRAWQGSLVGGCASVLVSGEFASALSLGSSPWEATHLDCLRPFGARVLTPRAALPHCEAVRRQIRVTAQLWRSFWAGPCGLTAITMASFLRTPWSHQVPALPAVPGARLGPLRRPLLTAFTACGEAGLLVNDKEHLF